MLTFIIKNFGCKTNQYEAQGIREALLGAGMHEADETAQAQVLIVNSCAVTGRAGASCRNAIRKAKKHNPAIRIILTGCAVDIAEDWISNLEIEACFKNSRKSAIVAHLTGVDDQSAENRFAFSINAFAGHTRAFLKIQDGCDNFCSYCIIPYARGNPISRPARNILAEARQLVKNGYRELVLTGINIGAYDYMGLRLADIIQKLAGIEGLLRLRLGSVEPIYCTEKLLQTICDNPIICPHLHLPLQSGDDHILRAMNRKYTVSEFLSTVELAREILPDPAITTDIIVGFPGEDQRSFEHTLQTVRTARFSRSHIFLFSPREGTPAAKMKACAQWETDCRKDELTILTDNLAAQYAASMVGREENVILERPCLDENGTNLWEGYSSRYLRTLVVASKECEKGKLVKVQIDCANGAELQAHIID